MSAQKRTSSPLLDIDILIEELREEVATLEYQANVVRQVDNHEASVIDRSVARLTFELRSLELIQDMRADVPGGDLGGAIPSGEGTPGGELPSELDPAA